MECEWPQVIAAWFAQLHLYLTGEAGSCNIVTLQKWRVQAET